MCNPDCCNFEYWATVTIGNTLIVVIGVWIMMTRGFRARIRQLEAQLTVDPLTGLLTRRGFEFDLDRRLQRWSHESHDGLIAVLWLDGNHFKSVNDRFGHARGDQVLARLGALLRHATRPEDLVARMGGDEFTVLLYVLDTQALATVVSRIHRQVVVPVEDVAVTCAIGAVVMRQGESVQDAMQRADALMYQSKAVGHPVTALL